VIIIGIEEDSKWKVGRKLINRKEERMKKRRTYERGRSEMESRK
jgi:hypothetical protein